jgi:hypothetical protein
MGPLPGELGMLTHLAVLDYRTDLTEGAPAGRVADRGFFIAW